MQQLHARVIGRSDDGRFHVLKQDGVGGTIFRWPARGEDAAGAAALIKISPASTAGATSPASAFCLLYPSPSPRD